MNGLRRTRVMVLSGAALVLALAGCAGEDESAAEQARGAEPKGGDAQSAVALKLEVPDGAGRCAMPSVEGLRSMEHVLMAKADGEQGGVVRFSGVRSLAGDEVSSLSLAAPSGGLGPDLLGFDFQEGVDYLVATTGTDLALCGYSGPLDPDRVALYEEAFGPLSG